MFSLIDLISRGLILICMAEQEVQVNVNALDCTNASAHRLVLCRKC